MPLVAGWRERIQAQGKEREALRRIIELTAPPLQDDEVVGAAYRALFEIHKVAAEAYGLKRGL
jgi:hypothetical protein